MQTKSNILYAFTHTILGEKKSKIAKLSRSARPRSSRHSRHCSRDCASARLRGNPAKRRGTPSRHTPLRVSAWAARAVARPGTLARTGSPGCRLRRRAAHNRPQRDWAARLAWHEVSPRAEASGPKPTRTEVSLGGHMGGRHSRKASARGAVPPRGVRI